MMVERIEAIDRDIFLWINGMYHPWLDEIMWIISGKILWIILISVLCFFYWRKTNSKSVIILILGCLFCILLADFLSVHLFKNVFQRFRPSHNHDIGHMVHLYKYSNGHYYKGGHYGFVSSHAANFFAIGTWVYLSIRTSMKHYFIPIVTSVLLICYSRIYLGVHYPSDVFAGGILGILIGILMHFLNIRLINNKVKR